jgi:GNAT superfamily N-acetyltransferase
MSGRRMNLMRFFLKSSPSARHDRFTQIFATGVSEKNPPPVIKSDEQYVYDFLNRLEVTGPSIAAIAAHRTLIASSNKRFNRVFPQPKTMRVPAGGASGEPEQLLECIRSAINMVEGGVALYQ